MQEPKFEYGPICRGIYIGLISGVVLVVVLDYRWVPAYILFLIFIGFGLRAFIEKTGLYHLFRITVDRVSGQLNKAWVEQKRTEANTKERQKKLKHSRAKDPKLPKNW